MRHGGKFVMDSAVLAAAATVLAYAEIHRMDVSDHGRHMLDVGPPKASGGTDLPRLPEPGEQDRHRRHEPSLPGY